MIKKVLLKIEVSVIKLTSYFNVRFYMKHYIKYLRKIGVNVPEYDGRSFIMPNLKLDGTKYSLITIGQAVTISTDIRILVHDYSISRGLKCVLPDFNENFRYRFMKPVVIGDNAFVGAGTIILPGSVIGEGSIIGAGSVVHGHIPNGVVAAGNPAKVITSVKDWGGRHAQAKDFEIIPKK